MQFLAKALAEMHSLQQSVKMAQPLGATTFGYATTTLRLL